MNKQQFKYVAACIGFISMFIGVAALAGTAIISFSNYGTYNDIDSILFKDASRQAWYQGYTPFTVITLGLVALSMIADNVFFDITSKSKKSIIEGLPHWIMGVTLFACISFTMSFFPFRVLGLVPMILAGFVIANTGCINPSTDDTEPGQVIPCVLGLATYIAWRVFFLPFWILTLVSIAGFALFIIVRISKRRHEFTISDSSWSMSITGVGIVSLWLIITSLTYPKPLVIKTTKSYFLESRVVQREVAATIDSSAVIKNNGNWKAEKIGSAVTAVVNVNMERVRDSVTLSLPVTFDYATVSKFHQNYWDEWRGKVENETIRGAKYTYQLKKWN